MVHVQNATIGTQIKIGHCPMVNWPLSLTRVSATQGHITIHRSDGHCIYPVLEITSMFAQAIKASRLKHKLEECSVFFLNLSACGTIGRGREASQLI